MKVFTVVGARPQFIKAAVVSRALAEAEIEEVLAHTGQHYDAGMSDVFFEELDIPKPRHALGVGSGPHGWQTGRMLEGLERAMRDERPDWVLVYGDTNSTLAGALAAAKLLVRIAHVEAGLRSFNRAMPEEVNRVLTDHAAELLFAPTDAAAQHLLREGIPGDRIERVGDVMLDAATLFGRRADVHSDVLSRLHLEPKSFVLATIHRAENVGDAHRFASILEALRAVARELPVVWPIHPGVRAKLSDETDLGGVRIIEPIGYLDMLRLERAARAVATDSGGVQKEAFFAGTSCITIRTETEWTELVDAGWNVLADPRDPRAIAEAILERLDAVGRPCAPYGDGNSAAAIAAALVRREVG